MKHVTKLLQFIFYLTPPLFLLCSCAPTVSPNTYTTSEVGVVSRVKQGVIISKRTIDINNNTNVGGAAGVVAGGAAGSMLGHNAQTGIIGAVGGAIVGGLAGNALEQKLQHGKGYEYIIKLKEGPMISVVQAQTLPFVVNEHVLVLYGATTRIIHDNTYTQKHL